LLHGNAEEKPFVDALDHLLACKREASLYDPDIPEGVKELKSF
jgi:hypothetical protein